MAGHLRIFGRGELELSDISQFLIDLESAYNSIYAFDQFVRYGRHHERPFSFISGTEPLITWLTGRTQRGRKNSQSISLTDLAEIVAQGQSFVPQTSRLRLSGVTLHSPGVWEFLGSLNPLEVIRNYLNDRHERRKDLDYRSAAEKRRLDL